MGLNRRDFLKWGSFVTAGLTLPAVVKKQLPPLVLNETEELSGRRRGSETYKASVCGFCPAGCGVVVRLIDGKPVSLAGHAGHPVNQGTLCPRGLAGLQEYYHPDRLRTPLRQVGKRGDGKWEKISWQAALSTIAEKLRALRAQNQAHTVAFLVKPLIGASQLLLERFARAYGTTNVRKYYKREGQGPIEAWQAMLGSDAYSFDLPHTRFVTSFGWDWLQTFPSPCEAQRAYGILRRGTPGRRVRMIQFEPRLSITAAKADEWVPIQPGSEGAVALGLAWVLIQEHLYDHDFVSRTTLGFDRFRDMVLSNFSPQQVAEAAVIPVDTIVRIARELADHRPALALADNLRLPDQMAVVALNALVGSIGIAGGILPRKEIDFPFPIPLARDDRSQKTLQQGGPVPMGQTEHTLRATAHPEDFSFRSLTEQVNFLVLNQVNPVFSEPDYDVWKNVLQEIPFIVSCAAFLDETNNYADLVLPESTFLERWQDVPTTTVAGQQVWGLAEPVIPTSSMGNTLSFSEILLTLARMLGEPVASAFPWRDISELLRQRAEGLADLDQGTLLDAKNPSAAGSPAFWHDLVAAGGWKAKPNGQGEAARKSFPAQVPRFPTSSGKIEFFCSALQYARNKSAPAIPDKLAGLPFWEAPVFVGAQEGYPFFLHLFTPLAFLGRHGAHLPLLQGIAGPHLRERWETWVEINPETAHQWGFSEKSWVWVESPRGKIRARVRYYTGLVPNVVSIPFGLGHTAYGRWAKGIGENPLTLVVPKKDEPSWQWLHQFTCVKIYPMGET